MNKITMRLLCLILAVSGLANRSFGQDAGDTIVVYVDNRFEIKVAVKDYDDLRNSKSEIDALRQFSEHLPQIADQLNPEQADLVKFINGVSITVEPGTQQYNFLFKDGSLSDTGYRDRAEIKLVDSKIFITAGNLINLMDYNLADCLLKTIPLLPEKNRHSKTLYYECKAGVVSELSDRHTLNSSLDMLSLGLGAGAGLVKGRWVADLTFELNLQFNRKGVLRHSPYVSTNILFDFAADGKMSVNTFLNAGFRWNIDKEEDSADWLGVDVGYLVGKEGDLFGDNTVRLGLNWTMIKGRSVTVSPNLYFTDNFKTIFPGVRVGFGL